jgi:DNA-binding response OmpR family regulator
MSIKVAVLEDDEAFREDILVRGLRQLDFDVEGFATSAELYRRMLAVSFDLLVLDVRLEGENGLDVAQYLRGMSPIGIVALTGRGTQEDRIRGLMEAVDVWLSKPIDVEVLAATLHSLSRRMQLASSDTRAASSPGWRLSPGNWRLVAPDERSMALNLLERRLLTRLLATPGELVSHDELIGEVSTGSEKFDRHRLEILIHRLRRKAQSRLGQELPLRSVRGSGYVLLGSGEHGDVA